jgi:hypothetical protein
MSEEQQEQERDNAADPDDGSGGENSAQEAAQKEEEAVEEAKQVMSELEEGEPPEDLADWPGGKAKYQTYGGPEGEEGYDEAATQKLGPSSLRHHEDGSVTVEGEEVDNPDEYKSDPIPGGPSDPDAPPDPAMVGEEDDDMGSDDSDDSDGDDAEKRDSGADEAQDRGSDGEGG